VAPKRRRADRSDPLTDAGPQLQHVDAQRRARPANRSRRPGAGRGLHCSRPTTTNCAPRCRHRRRCAPATPNGRCALRAPWCAAASTTRPCTSAAATRCTRSVACDDAAQAFRAALAVGDVRADAYNRLGVVLFQAGDHRGARQSFETRAGVLEPGHGDARANLDRPAGGVRRPPCAS
jgi:hypothetical protein